MGNPRLPATSGITDRDLDMLAWTGEQYGARLDHLMDLMDTSRPMVQRIVRRLAASELVRVERIVVAHPTWVIPTATGLAACGLNYEVWTPALATLLHTGAINDVRLHIQAQRADSEWISERQLELEKAKEKRRGRHVPDGVLILDGREVAVEVELSAKGFQRTETVLTYYSQLYDAIMYYCAPKAHRLLTQIKQTGRWPKLEVRELPKPRYIRKGW